jgi:peptidoglycan hydrolase CwlO-like protein
MKKLLVFVIGLMVLVSCHNYKKDAEQLTMVRDSLKQESDFKDSSIVEFLNDFNEIQANLDSIKKLEDLVTVQSAQGREMNTRQKQLILDDIALLNDLIQKNKEQTASLQKKLNNANFKIGKLNTMVAEFETMVNNLEMRVQEKDGEILALNQEVQKLNIDISSLNQKITEIETVSQQKTQTIESQTVALNKAFFAYGTSKELKDNGVIEKTGGLLGIGRTAEIKEDFNRDYFTEIDIRDFDIIPLMVKKAEVISVHPAGSFHISGEKTADT